MSRARAVAAVLLLAACGEEEPVVVIENFRSRTPLVECRSVQPRQEFASVTSVRSVTDSTFLVIDAVGRRASVLGVDLAVLRSFELPEQGPGSVGRPMDGFMWDDSTLVLADGDRSRLVAVYSDAKQAWSLPLSFPPQGVARAGDRLLIAALGMDARIGSLLHERDGDRVTSAGVPFIPTADALARMFANSVLVRGLADGSAVVVHQMIWPRAWLIPSDGSAHTRIEIPMPDGEAERVGFIPEMPFAEEDLDLIAVPVIALSEIPDEGFLYLTRSGGRTGSNREKAVVRTRRDFSYLGSARLSVNATRLVYLPAQPDSMLVVDDDLQWHRCPVPPSID